MEANFGMHSSWSAPALRTLHQPPARVQPSGIRSPAMAALFPAPPSASASTSAAARQLDLQQQLDSLPRSTPALSFAASFLARSRVARDPLIEPPRSVTVPAVLPFPGPRARTDPQSQMPTQDRALGPAVKLNSFRSKRDSFLSAISSHPSGSTKSPKQSAGFSYSPTVPPAPPLRSSGSSTHTRASSHSGSSSSGTGTSPIPRPDSHSSSLTAHPFNNPAVSPAMDEDMCPVCCEDLAMRLQGEKPHVVPVCGHRLHRACFEAVYGSYEHPKPGSLGLCGVCRRDMKLGDQSAQPGRKNKFAAMTGTDHEEMDDPFSFKRKAVSRGTIDDSDDDYNAKHDPAQDDDLVQLPSFNSSKQGFSMEYTGGISSSSTVTAKAGLSGSGLGGGWDVVRPVVTVQAEQSTVERSTDPTKKQHLTCLVTIEMPPKYPRSRVNFPLSAQTSINDLRSLSLNDRAGSQRTLSTQRPPSQAMSPASSRESIYSSYAYNPTAALSPVAPNPFAGVVEDLKARMSDWKNHSPDEFGQLKMYDFMHVRKKESEREFLVYLFEEAILCVADEKGTHRQDSSPRAAKPGQENVLKLKGRVYVRHITALRDSSHGSEISLTITLGEDGLEDFVMVFPDRHSQAAWQKEIEALRTAAESPRTAASAKAQPMAPSGSNDSMIGSEYSATESSRTGSSAFSAYTRTTHSSAPHQDVIHEEGAISDFGSPVSAYAQSGFTHSSGAYPSLQSSLSLTPRDFTPLDLMLILAVPGPGGPTSLKVNIIKSSLEFLLQSVGPRTRVSIVTFSSGEGSRGVLRKTPFIALGKPDGRQRLEQAVHEIGCEEQDCRMTSHHKEDRVNVVTAVNLALDILLQRKAKSALSGVLLMNDARDGAHKHQMDLVMTRAEAANVPIHAVGWGKSHDPTSLWVLSNHTGGTYTFLREFYDLRDGLAGVVGGMLSIAATAVKLHIRVPESRWVRVRKVTGTPKALVSSEGRDVDIDVGELRHGERKDLLVEVEMTLSGLGQSQPRKRTHEPSVSTATDAFFLSKVGLDPSVLDDYSQSFYDDGYDGLADEVPVFEVNAAYKDPAAAKSVSRLNHTPTLLTVNVCSRTPSSEPRQGQPSSPDIVRRRMELLSSDMLSRALLLMTRRNDAQAERLLKETARIISTIANSLAGGSQAEAEAKATLAACAEDVQTVLEGCARREQFDGVIRNLAAQQAVVLRDQRAWTPRTATERRFWTADNSTFLVAKSQHFVSA